MVSLKALPRKVILICHNLFEKPEKTDDLMDNALPKRRPKEPIERLTLLTENLCAAKEGRLPWLSGVFQKFSRV